MEDLKRLGLSSYEAKIYTSLLQYGRMSAREIAEKSSVPPTAVYPNLKRLVLRNFVQELSGELSYFEPVDPAVVIPAFIQNKKKLMDELEIALVEQTKVLFHQKQQVKMPEVLNVSLGKEASSAIYLDALKRTSKTYYILGWTFQTSKAKFVKLQHLIEAKNKGVAVRIIVSASQNKEWPVLEEYAKQGIDLRYYPLQNFSLLIVDGRECKITLKNPEYDQKFNLHIKDPSLSEAMQGYFLNIWEKAKPLSLHKVQTLS